MVHILYGMYVHRNAIFAIEILHLERLENTLPVMTAFIGETDWSCIC